MLTSKLLRVKHHYGYILPVLRTSLVHSDAKLKGENKRSRSTPMKSPEAAERMTSLDLVRQFDKIEETHDLFPSLNQLGVSTRDRTHIFSASCDKVIKFIKMGAINKNITIQYCHYLAHLARNCEKNDHGYFAKRSHDLMTFILRTDKDLHKLAKSELVCDISSTSESNCALVCDEIIGNQEFFKDLNDKDYSKLLTSCYKFGRWDLANKMAIFGTEHAQLVHLRLFDPLVNGLIEASEKYKKFSSEFQDEKKLFKDEVLEHLFKLIEKVQQYRIPFVTKFQTEFIKALDDLDIKVVKNPTIKISGRCTCCNTHIPIYDSRSTKELNVSIKQLLGKQTDTLYHNTNPDEIRNFEEFLIDLHKNDGKPIDCVIDGLNIAYKNTQGYYFLTQTVNNDFERTIKRHDPNSQVQVLINTIIRGNLLQSMKKILVIGRNHMKNWPGLLNFFERNNIHYFFTSNSSKDDMLQLYAATLNPKTVIFTNDFFRDHIALLNGEARIRLERWIDTHQAWVLNKTLKPILPTPYEKIPSVDRSSGHFHIPIVDYHKLDNIAFHEPPPHLNNKMTMWICCKKDSLPQDT